MVGIDHPMALLISPPVSVLYSRLYPNYTKVMGKILVWIRIKFIYYSISVVATVETIETSVENYRPKAGE